MGDYNMCDHVICMHTKHPKDIAEEEYDRGAEGQSGSQPSYSFLDGTNLCVG